MAHKFTVGSQFLTTHTSSCNNRYDIGQYINGYTTAIRRQYDGSPTSCCHRKTIGHLRNAFEISKSADATDANTECTRRQHDGVPMATRRVRRQYELNTKVNLRNDLRGFFGMPKIFWPLPKLLPMLKNGHRWLHDGYTNVPMVLRSVPNLKFSIFVMPSGVKIG